MTRIRYEVEGAAGGLIIRIDTAILDRLTPTQRDLLDRLIDEALTDLRLLGIHDPELWLAAEVAQRIADQRGYEREAQRRGVLAL